MDFLWTRHDANESQSIVKVEKSVRALVDAEAFAASPIRYLILDFTHVTGIDFSAAEAFGRMNRILHSKEVKTALAGVTIGSDVGKSLEMVACLSRTTIRPPLLRNYSKISTPPSSRVRMSCFWS